MLERLPWGGVRGNILDLGDLQPVVGATASIGIASSQSDHRGQFAISNAPIGTHTLIVTHPDYLPFSRKVDVRWNEDLDISVHLTGQKGVVAGRITNQWTAVPVRSAIVLIGRQASVSNADGVFEVADIPLGSHTLILQHRDYDPTPTPVTLDRPQLNIDVAASPRVPILESPLVSIRQTRPGGDIIVSCSITVYDAGGLDFVRLVLLPDDGTWIALRQRDNFRHEAGGVVHRQDVVLDRAEFWIRDIDGNEVRLIAFDQ